MNKTVFGKPGAGKGMWCIAEVVDELRYTERNIVTNLPIRVEPWVTTNGEARCGLRAFMRKTYKDEFDLDKRLVLLEEHEEEMPEFFAWRAPGVKVDVKRDDEGRAVEFDAEAAKKVASCLYLVDEAWKWFGARDWARTGKGVVWYGRQHRKFGDSVWYATQNADDLDKVLRGLCQGFVQVVNQSKLPMFGFRRPNAISWKEFGDWNVKGSFAMATGMRKVDAKGLGGCYDTSAGVGIRGGHAADSTSRKKGLPWQLIPVAMGGVAVALVFVPKLIGGAVAHTLTTMTSGALKGMTNMAAVPINGTLSSNGVAPSVPGPVMNVSRSQMEYGRLYRVPGAGGPGDRAASGMGSRPGQAVEEAMDVYISGVAFDHGIGRVFLSNGESYTAADRELQLVDKHFVVINGKVYRWKRPDAPTGPVQPLVSAPAMAARPGVVVGPRVIEVGR
ncbi:MAG: hypothetical protein ACYDH9_18560 [Limisphaerales bacterium]